MNPDALSDVTHFYSDKPHVAICGAAASFGIGTAAREFVSCEKCKALLGTGGPPSPVLGAQQNLAVLADWLEERGDKRADTVRLMGRDLLAIVTEFERLQELEMVAGDLYREATNTNIDARLLRDG